MPDGKTEEYTYQVDKISFVVTPVYNEQGETVTAILLKLMKADTERTCTASTSLTRAGGSGIL